MIVLFSLAGKKTGGLKQLLSRFTAKIRGRPVESPSSESTAAAQSSVLSSKLLFKIILVAGVAATWQYFSTDK